MQQLRRRDGDEDFAGVWTLRISVRQGERGLCRSLESVHLWRQSGVDRAGTGISDATTGRGPCKGRYITHLGAATAD